MFYWIQNGDILMPQINLHSIMPQGLTSPFGSGLKVYVYFAHSEMYPFLLQQKDNPKAAEQGVRFEKGMTGKSLADDSLAILTGLQVIFTDIILLNF